MASGAPKPTSRRESAPSAQPSRATSSSHPQLSAHPQS